MENPTRENRSHTCLSSYARQHIQHPELAERVAAVMSLMPFDVLQDLMNDPHFHLAMEDYRPGSGTKVWMTLGNSSWTGSRSVVLRPRLADCDERFAHYVIAHEFAHAHLRNGGWQHWSDPEEAADALAESWGFHRPAISAIQAIFSRWRGNA